ncbi:MAG: lysylphosphatidylglycerol synthase transmembrane domain-containing protein [Bacteroidota bacterium]
MERKKLLNYLKLLLKLAVTAAALIFVFHKIDIREVGSVFRTANLLLILAALVLFIFSKVISAYRLNRYFRAIGIRLSNRFNLRFYLLGMYYNLFLPGGIGGDGYKIYYLSRRSEVRTRSIFWAVMLDRVIGVLALFCLAVVFSWFTALPALYLKLSWLLIPLALLASWLGFHWFFRDFERVFLSTNLQSLAVQVLQTLSALLILLAIDVKSEFMPYLFVFLVSSIVAVLPVTVGGVGSREFTFLLGAQWLGLDLNLSIALSFIFYLITAFTSLWGILFSLSPRWLNGPAELKTEKEP